MPKGGLTKIPKDDSTKLLNDNSAKLIDGDSTKISNSNSRHNHEMIVQYPTMNTMPSRDKDSIFLVEKKQEHYVYNPLALFS